MQLNARQRRRRNRRALLALSIAVVAGALWYRSATTRPVSPASSGDTTRAIAPGAGGDCGWPALAASTANPLDPYTTAPWKALWQGRPGAALDLFRREAEETAGHAAGQLRSLVEIAGIVRDLKHITSIALRQYLDTRLEHLPAQPGAEVFPFLRAAVALQEGERVAVSAWLEQVPADGSLGSARKVLESIAAEPLDAALTPEAAAAERWVRHLEAYGEALGGLDCPLPGAAAAHNRALAALVKQARFPTEAAIDAIDPAAADFRFGRCDGGSGLQIDLYDPTLYTTLWWVAVREIEAATPEGAGGRFFQLMARREVRPETAKQQACALAAEAGAWNDAAGQLPWLAFGDWLSPAEMRQQLEAVCRGEAPACPASFDDARDLLQREQDQAEACYSRLASGGGEAGGLARELQLYAGIVRRRYLTATGAGACPPPLQDDMLRLWKGSMTPETRWDSLDAALRWVEVDLVFKRYSDGPRELFGLAETQSMYRPAFESVRRASGTAPSHPGGLSN
jgi:hypothetical protein